MTSWLNTEPPQFEIPRPNPESMNLIPRMYSPLLQHFTEEELKEVREAAYKAFDKTGLKDKGIEILNITEETKADVLAQIRSEAKADLAKRTILQKLGLYIQAGMSKLLNPVGTEKLVNVLADCETAGYFPTIKKIIVNMNSAPDLSFHEMGHALTDKYGNFFSKLNIKSRFYVLALAPVFLLTSLIKAPKKNKDEKPESIVDKTTTFIKNNCGKLVAASFIPILIDEGLASIKGQKLAKEVISSKDILNGLKNTHLKAYSTYLFVAGAAGGLSALAVHLRDKLSSKSKKSDNY